MLIVFPIFAPSFHGLFHVLLQGVLALLIRFLGPKKIVLCEICTIVWCKKMDTHLLLYTVANVYPFFCIRLYYLYGYSGSFAAQNLCIFSIVIVRCNSSRWLDFCTKMSITWLMLTTSCCWFLLPLIEIGPIVNKNNSLKN